MELVNSKNTATNCCPEPCASNGSIGLFDFIVEAYKKELERRERSDWYVDGEGYLCHKGEYYEIDPDRLAENWIGHMARKRWVNMNTFIPAYIEACERAGVQQVNITY